MMPPTDDIQRVLGYIEGRLKSIDNNIDRLLSEAKEDRADAHVRFGIIENRLGHLERRQSWMAGIFLALFTGMTFFKEKIITVFGG